MTKAVALANPRPHDTNRCLPIMKRLLQRRRKAAIILTFVRLAARGLRPWPSPAHRAKPRASVVDRDDEPRQGRGRFAGYWRALPCGCSPSPTCRPSLNRRRPDERSRITPGSRRSTTPNRQRPADGGRGLRARSSTRSAAGPASRAPATPAHLPRQVREPLSRARAAPAAVDGTVRLPRRRRPLVRRQAHGPRQHAVVRVRGHGRGRNRCRAARRARLRLRPVLLLPALRPHPGELTDDEKIVGLAPRQGVPSAASVVDTLGPGPRPFACRASASSELPSGMFTNFSAKASAARSAESAALIGAAGVEMSAPVSSGVDRPISRCAARTGIISGRSEKFV